MKKFFIVAMMAVAAVVAKADPQDNGTFSFTPHVGFGYAHLTNLDKCSNGGSIALGCDAQYKFDDLFGVSGGLDVTYIQSRKDSYSTIGNLYLTTWAINIPILAQFHLGDNWALKAGVQPGFLINPSIHGQARGSYLSGDERIKDYTNNFQFSIPVGVSYEFNNPLTLELRANIPVTKMIDKGTKTTAYIVTEDVRMFTVNLTVGYRLDLDD